MGNPLHAANSALDIPGRVQKTTQRRFKLRSRTRLITSIGVLTGDAAEPVPGSRASRRLSISGLTAGACLVIGLLIFIISYALFL